MCRLLMVSLLVAVASCAGFSGGNLKPGVADEADVERAMGPSADRRQHADGEVVRYYSRLPEGREMYAARFGRDGKLIAIEQWLTREYANQLVVGKSTREDVRDLLGPPYRVNSYPAIPSEVWLYPMRQGAVRMTLNVDFGARGVVRELGFFDVVDPD